MWVVGQVTNYIMSSFQAVLQNVMRTREDKAGVQIVGVN